jgi:hypothetical protein
MKSKRQPKPYWKMNIAELAGATREFDAEIVADQARPLSPDMRARWVRAKAKTSRRNGTAVLKRLLEPVSRSLNLEAARKLVRLKADARTQARVDELARKCNEGELTPAERAE